jgi:hypothetical protein
VSNPTASAKFDEFLAGGIILGMGDDDNDGTSELSYL